MTTFIQLSLIHGDDLDFREQGLAFFGPDGNNKIPMIKTVRDAFPGSSLLECKNFVDRLLNDANYTFRVAERKKINEMISHLDNKSMMEVLVFIKQLKSDRS